MDGVAGGALGVAVAPIRRRTGSELRSGVSYPPDKPHLVAGILVRRSFLASADLKIVDTVRDAAEQVAGLDARLAQIALERAVGDVLWP